MKRTLLILLFITLLGTLSNAQSTLHYQHDAAGNRTGRIVRNVAPRPNSLVIDSVLSQVAFTPMASAPMVGDSAAIAGDPLSTHSGILEEIAAEDSISALFSQMTARQLSYYSVGAIPLTEGITQTGAKTYSLAIPTAPGFDYVPSISLEYNSQSGNDVAGYGWRISGISSVTRTNKNQHFNNTVAAANAVTEAGSFALNGDPLLVNTEENLISSYSLMTFRGKVAMNAIASSGSVIKFNAAYPTGETAVFGTASNTTKMALFPILESQDVLGNKIEYEYYEDENPYGTECYIKSIKYGAKVLGNYTAHIDFIYENRADWHDLFFAGRKFLKKRLLKSIESYSNNVLLVRYNLTHELKEGVNLLKCIDCISSNGEQLPPIDFTYLTNDNAPSDSLLFIDRSIDLSSFFPTQDFTNRPSTVPRPTKKIAFHRGKFTTGSFNDGFVVYPENPTSADDEFVILNYKRDPFSGERFSPVGYSMALGEGFIGINSVDIDGDGADELVKLNTSVSGNETRLDITVYTFSESGAAFSQRCFYKTIGGKISIGSSLSGYSYYPRPVYVRWGDFDGLGRASLLLLTAQECSLAGGNTATFSDSHIRIIDLNTEQIVLSQSHEIHESDIDGIFCADINSDLKYELCILDGYGSHMGEYIKGTSHFSYNTTYSIGLNILSEDGPYLADMNGDGYLDFIVPPTAGSNSNTWMFACFTGNEYLPYACNIAPLSEDSNIILQDINHDGLSDILVKEYGTLHYYVNNNLTSFSSASFSPFGSNHSFDVVNCSFADINGVSCPAIIRNGSLRLLGYSRDLGQLRLISRVRDSFGNTNTLRFKSMSSSNVYQIDTTRAYDPATNVAKFSLPIYLLSGDYTVSSSLRVKDLRYTYYDAAWGTTGLGFLGFGKIRTQNEINNTTQTDTYLPEKYGAIQNSISKISFYEDGVISSVSNIYDNNTERGIPLPRLINSTGTDYLTGITKNTEINYDTRDFQKKLITRSWTDNLGADTLTVITEYTYSHQCSSTLYLLGSPMMTSSRKGIGMNPERLWEERSLFWRNAKMQPTKQKVFVGWDTTPSGMGLRGPIIPQLTPDDLEEMLGRANNLLSETQWTYTTKGKVKTQKTAKKGSSTFVGETYTYDLAGQFLQTKKDIFNQTTTYLNYDKWGQPTRITDPRGNDTYSSYDSWGQLVSVQTPDGGQENIARQWDSTVTKSLYKTTVSKTGEPDKVSYTTALGQTIRTGTKTKEGGWRYMDKQYQRNGLLYKESLPFRSADSILWRNLSYDAYRRLTEELHPGGGRTVYSYNGSSVETVKDSIETIRTIDGWGRLISVQDAGGTVSYVLLEHDGPASVIAPGGISTTFTYDDFGNRESINDPSAGNVTESWTNQLFGTVAHTITNALGTITQYEDKYGHTYNIVRSDGNISSFVYDSYGNLKKTFTTGAQNDTLHVQRILYDSIGRLSKTIETQYDAGNVAYQLTTELTYGTGSVLRSKRYSVGNTVLATEHYGYSNGHLVSIKLSDSTVVWTLNAENALGQVTGEYSGSILKEATFSNTGLPATRRMASGVIQNTAYSFASTTSNMMSRTDVGRSLSETFTYDALNRLKTIGQQNIKYDNSGNIKRIEGIVSMSYPDNDNPYRLAHATPATSGIIPSQTQNLTFTSFGRPRTISQGAWKADFDYGESDERTIMRLRDVDSVIVMTRFYAQSGAYERDVTAGGSTTERLYLGGDAYDAPMVLVKTGSGSSFYVIGRDVLGSITHICTPSGTLVAEYSYDAWGRQRNPQDIQLYTPGQEPDLLLGRGWTGHEWLPWFGLYNANARLYDPYIARFLSPDPYVQSPDFTQNFNRYLYGYGNPLKYVDKDGKFPWFIPAIIGGIANWAINGSKFNLSGLAYFGVGFATGAVSSEITSFASNALKINGIIPGSFLGSGAGALTGMCTNFVYNGLNNVINGRNFFFGAKEALLSGALSGSISGAFLGGINGYNNSIDSGKNIWWGSEVKFGRSPWSFFTSEKPFATIRFDGIRTSMNGPFSCVPDTYKELSDYFGGDYQFNDPRFNLNYNPAKGTSGTIGSFKDDIGTHFNTNQIGTAVFSKDGIPILERISQNRTILSIYLKDLKVGNYIGDHMDVIRSVLFFSNKTIINLRIGSFAVNDLNIGLILMINGLK